MDPGTFPSARDRSFRAPRRASTLPAGTASFAGNNPRQPYQGDEHLQIPRDARIRGPPPRVRTQVSPNYQTWQSPTEPPYATYEEPQEYYAAQQAPIANLQARLTELEHRVKDRGRSRDGSEDKDSTRHTDSEDSDDLDDPSWTFRPRVSTRGPYPTEDDYDHSEESDVEDASCPFKLKQHQPDPSSLDDPFADVEASVLSEEKITPQTKAYSPLRGSYNNVMKSRYTGDGVFGGLQRAELTVVSDSWRPQQSVFRWIHIEDKDMIFEDFQDEVSRIPGLSDPVRLGITKLLGLVKRKFDRPLQTSRTGSARIMKPTCSTKQLPRMSGPKTSSSQAKTIKWICLPYFSLEEYAGAITGLKNGSHPMRTLLQARFLYIGKDRDMQQAVCYLPDNPPGYVFHIAEVWCLIIDDSVLVTCARVPMSTLHGSVLSVLTSPSPGINNSDIQKILVSYGTSVLWSFPVAECETWFALLKKFSEFWPRPVRLLHQGKPVTADSWPRLLSFAKHGSSVVQLTLQFGWSRRRVRGVLQNTKSLLGNNENQDQGSNTQNGVETDEVLKSEPNEQIDQLELIKDFCVFTWLNMSLLDKEQGSWSVDQEKLRRDLEDMEGFMAAENGMRDQLAYKRCPKASYDSIILSLRKESEYFLNAPEDVNVKKFQKLRRNYENRVDVFNAAESVFQFFFPLSVKGPTVKQFWGALNKVVKPPPSAEQTNDNSQWNSQRNQQDQLKDEDLGYISDILGELDSLVKPFKEILSQASPEERSKINLPDELINAWLYFVRALMFITKRSYFWEEQIKTVSKLLDRGMKKVMESLGEKSLLEYSVVMPQEVASLISLHLLHDLTPSERDISETYAEYLRLLESEIDARPLDRSNQDKLSNVQQEMTVIRETLASQRMVFAQIAISDQNESSSKTAEKARKSQNDQNQYFQMVQTQAIQTMVDPNYRHPADANYPADAGRTKMTEEMRIEPRYQVDHGGKYETQARMGDAPPGYYGQSQAQQQPPPYESPVVIELSSSTSRLSPTDPGGYRNLLLAECFDLIESKSRDFEEMDKKVLDLQDETTSEINNNKDRQEAAVYAFTVVTIIFLPLSTVAGIFGMNTTDIRNTSLTQWIFWVISVPLAFIIIFLCLAWAGELGNFWRGFTNLWRPKGSRRVLRGGVLNQGSNGSPDSTKVSGQDTVNTAAAPVEYGGNNRVSTRSVRRRTTLFGAPRDLPR